MTIETIYIARHGYRANWLPEHHPPNPTGIDSDPPLAPHGVDQAKELGKYIGSLPKDLQPQFIISSPFYRCVETSSPIAHELNLKVCIDTGIGEWFKTDREVVPKPAGYDQLGGLFPEVLGNADLWKGSGVVPKDSGETEDDIFARAQRFWTAFIPAFEAAYPEIKRILFVTHAATKIALGMALMKLDSLHQDITYNGEKTKLRAGACSIDKYVDEGGHWELLENGRTDFLTDGEEMNWNFDVKFEAGSDEDIKARKAAAKKNTEYEEVYLTVDIPIVAPSYYDEVSREGVKDEIETTSFSEQLLINPNAKFQITRLDEDNPLFKVSNNANAAADPESLSFSNLSAIDGQIHQTTWTKLLGTELIFDENGEFVGTVREHLVTDPSVKIKLRPQATAEDLMNTDSENEEVDTKTAFFKKALSAAKAKSNKS